MWIEDEQVGRRDKRTESSVNHGRGTASHSADDILHVSRAGERDGLSAGEIELIKAVKKIRPGQAAQIGADQMMRSGQSAFESEASIHGNLSNCRIGHGAPEQEQNAPMNMRAHG